MRKTTLYLFIVILFLSMPAQAEQLRIGALIYDGEDAFMTSVFNLIRNGVGNEVEILYRDSQNMQSLQNEQIEQLLGASADALIINAVDRTAIIYLIKMIKPHDIPVIFINREPLHEDLLQYDKAYYVGNDPKQSGTMCGEILADYFLSHPEADINGDGVIQYVMLRGEPGHQDAELRSKHSILAMQQAGFQLEKLAEDTAMWQRAKAKDIMAGFLSSFGDRIECVIANNDEMALGAIEALKAIGVYSEDRFIPVVGVDATEPARAAVREGTLLGTVVNDSVSIADAALKLATLLARNEAVDELSFPYAINEARYVFTESQKVIAETMK